MSINAKGESSITSDILRDRRQYFIKDVKAPFLNSLVKCFQRGKNLLGKLCLLFDIWKMVLAIFKYPEPTKENTKKHISHILLDIWDEFFRLDTTENRTALFKAIKRISVTTVEHDIHYSQRITWFLMKLTAKYLNGEWPALEPWCPMDNWNDPIVQQELLKAAQEFRVNLTINGKPFNEVET